MLWATVMVFGAVAVGFLWVRLDEELEAFDDTIDGTRLVDVCRGTPFEAQVTGLQKVNLVLVLLITQFLQVLLLSVAVFGFFIVFGSLAIDDSVITSWLGHAPTYSGIGIVSKELAQVATFLAAFSGLYFTVYAVTDATYRQQFFTAITRELELAVSARVAYRRLRSGA